MNFFILYWITWLVFRRGCSSWAGWGVQAGEDVNTVLMYVLVLPYLKSEAAAHTLWAFLHLLSILRGLDERLETWLFYLFDLWSLWRSSSFCSLTEGKCFLDRVTSRLAQVGLMSQCWLFPSVFAAFFKCSIFRKAVSARQQSSMLHDAVCATILLVMRFFFFFPRLFL